MRAGGALDPLILKLRLLIHATLARSSPEFTKFFTRHMMYLALDVVSCALNITELVLICWEIYSY